MAKNLYLSREKTITRKLKELYLAKRMEQELSKGRIIELYLNVIELGPMVYGIGHGAHYYFGKDASALSPRECAFLAAMLPGPRLAYNPYKNLGRVLQRSNMILRLLAGKGVLSQAEYQSALAESPNVGRLQKKVDESIKKVEVMANFSSARPAQLPAAGGEHPDGEEPGAPGPPSAPPSEPAAAREGQQEAPAPAPPPAAGSAPTSGGNP